MNRGGVMKRLIATLAAGAMLGVLAAAHAKLPAPPPKSEAEKAAEAQKAAAAKARAAEDLAKAQDRAVANYKRNRGGSADAKGQNRK